MKNLKKMCVMSMLVFMTYSVLSQNDAGFYRTTVNSGENTTVIQIGEGFIPFCKMGEVDNEVIPKTNFLQDSIKSESWPRNSSAISFYASSLLFASVLNCSYDWLVLTKNGHSGITAGLTYTAEHVFRNKFLGVHFAYTYLSGLKKNHLEVKLGGIYHFLQFGEDAFTFLPVISIGYRYQPPGNYNFFRIGVSTAGIGVGYGFALGLKSQPEYQERVDFSF